VTPGSGPAAATVWPCLVARADGAWLDVSVQPGARRTGVHGMHDGALRVRLCAPPIDGRANQCLIDWLADELGCAKRALRVARGASSRRKRVELDLPVARVADWLARTLQLTAGTSPRPSRPVR
jgi:uncharacterized protein (TIGR00251 family)